MVGCLKNNLLQNYLFRINIIKEYSNKKVSTLKIDFAIRFLHMPLFKNRRCTHFKINNKMVKLNIKIEISKT